jgi:hypothetical protein
MNSATIRYLDRLAAEQFWGIVALRFEHGTVVHLRKEENLKPSELSGTPRENNANNNN